MPAKFPLNVPKQMRLGIVAGEVSGDLLGAGLIHALRKRQPNLIVEGIAGPQMIAAGCHSLFPMEYLSVMGAWEVLKRLPKILAIRHKIIRHFLNNPPDVFIGIDVPDFNLTVEEKLKHAQIPTVHYVSPTVWAWKQWRLKKIARAVDLMLTLLPFEAQFYEKRNIPVRFVGHPLADIIPLQNDRMEARRVLGLRENKMIVAILPGSRANEIQYLGELFIRTALWCARQQPDLIFIAPMVNSTIRQQFTSIWQKVAPQLSLQLIDGQSQQVIAASDVVLLASGTATLEAMLVKRPMVVAYRMSALSFAIAKQMVKTPYISLPNLLANKMLVPEFIQDMATIESLGTALLNYLNNPHLIGELNKEFQQLHTIIQRNASDQAAQSVLELVACI